MDAAGARYLAVRDRLIETVRGLDDDQLATVVPACPQWTVTDLVAHLASMPMAILAGEVPESVMAGGDPNPWLAELVDEHGARDVGDLCHWWSGQDTALEPLVDGADLLLTDIYVHEGDLHGAVGSRAPRDDAELEVQIDAALRGLRPGLERFGLPPIAVVAGTGLRRSDDRDPGWTLRCGRWDAHRALNSRRTRRELMALAHDGDPGPYLDVLDEHLPLPALSLGES